MPTERAGYTVTMFLIDVSSSMGNIRAVEVENADKSSRTIEMTNLEWSLQYVKLKIQEMIFNGRKTDQCGVIIFGSEGIRSLQHLLCLVLKPEADTNNRLNTTNDGYESVVEYIPIAQPNARTLAKIDALQASNTSGDPIDALIVGIDSQTRYLGNKKWTRKIVIVTDGESPIEVEDWEATVEKMDELGVTLTVVGVDFDDNELPYTEPNKSNIKSVNENFYKELTSAMQSGVVGTCAYAIREATAPEVKIVKSTLVGTQLRIGDIDARSDEAIELPVKMSKCTALARPKTWKKFTLMQKTKTGENQMEVDEPEANFDPDKPAVYSQVKMKTEYVVEPEEDEDEDKETVKSEDIDGDVKMKQENDDDTVNLLDGKPAATQLPSKESATYIDKEDLIRGFKYGSTYAPCPDGQFPKLQTHKGIDVISFFPAKTFRRELAMGELSYVWADPNRPVEQVALSSIVQAMHERRLMAIGRLVTRDDMDPKMGVLAPIMFDGVDCLLWIPAPFADDVRKYTFASLDKLVNKKGEILTKHPYLPTQEQLEAMDKFVDAMDLMDAGEKTEYGDRYPWFDTRESYNPAIHRVKQAMFHCAVVKDIVEYPVPPPHPETIKYFDPPKRVLKRARDAVEEFPKKVAKAKREDYARVAEDEDDEMLLLDRKQPASSRTQSQMNIVQGESSSSAHAKVGAAKAKEGSETEDDDDEEEMLLDKKKTPPAAPASSSRDPLPTPARSLSPQIDAGRAPGRIIGNTYPLKDFKKNIARGDLVTKAVEDLAAVITEVVMKPFATRRTDEMLECMSFLRGTCLVEDEIDAWNAFIRDLKEKCLTKPGNPHFWEKIQGVGRELSLINKQEAKKQGGDSDVTENEAVEFIS
ncbi:hypothetical protein CVT25_014953 [Psilocybe cyanescens]|uniref:ATP-dependent DNA helicase II subunit 2 n=1 Tax=Psilocybe cyanescens TaxID=93625 RepID=A0A409XI44_PSICY|nr:hypothetical protein CVT25_014953 [Psilocybe cyanescens]